MRLIEKIILPAHNNPHTATVIFFHGSGNTRNSLKYFR